MNLFTKQKETHRLRKRTHGCWGEGTAKDFGMVMYTLLYLKWKTDKNIAHGTLLMLCASMDGRGVWGKMDTCICMTESLHYSFEAITTLLIGYTSIQNVFGVKN